MNFFNRFARASQNDELFMPIVNICAMRKHRRGFRLLLYFRTGYATYLMVLIGAVNVLTSTYFLAVDEIPFIKEIFPTFDLYVLTAVLIAIPIISVTGYVHFKRIGAHSASTALYMQNNVYNYKFYPGFNLEVFAPSYRAILRLSLKRANSEKFTDDDIQNIDMLRERLKHLIDGGSVGKYARGVIDD